ncbi:hypothetical protein HDU89_006266 [Geranomyces variabilis]|nr:hypothetical protein HDU89_006266 [Geranomyces variabilis]
MPRRRDLGDEARYVYQLEHFRERMQQRYGVSDATESDFLTLRDHIASGSPEVRELAKNKDGTIIYLVPHGRLQIVCNYDPGVTLPTTEGVRLTGMVTTVLDPKKLKGIRPR